MLKQILQFLDKAYNKIFFLLYNYYHIYEVVNEYTEKSTKESTKQNIIPFKRTVTF